MSHLATDLEPTIVQAAMNASVVDHTRVAAGLLVSLAGIFSWVWSTYAQYPSSFVVGMAGAGALQCANTSGGAALGLCRAGFVLGCESDCVLPGRDHNEIRCNILNRKYLDGLGENAPWLADCCANPLHLVSRLQPSSGTISSFFRAGIATSPTGSHVFFTGPGVDAVSVVDNSPSLAAPAIVGSLTHTGFYGTSSMAVSADGMYLYVVCPETGSLAILDVGSDPTNPKLVGETAHGELSGPQHVALAPTGNFAYVTCYYSNALAVVDVRTNVSSPTIVNSLVDPDNIEGASGVALSPNGLYAYVTGRASDSVAVIDVGQSPLLNLTVVGVIKNSTSLHGAATVTVSPGGDCVYVAAQGGSNLAIVDVSTNPTKPAISGTLTSASLLHYPKDVIVSASGKFVYVAAFGSNAVVMVNVTDPATPTFVGSPIGLPEPLSLALVPNDTSIVVRSRDSLTVLRDVCSTS